MGSDCTRSPFREILARRSDTAVDSSHVRPGASPRQNGIVGAAPFASSTRTRPASTRRMRHDVEPSMNTSPAMLSTAKSSSSVPTTVSSGSARTRNCALSGIAPPDVIAARRAPRRPRTTPCTRSRWRNAPLRPRLVLMPSDSMSMTASKSARVRSRIAIGAANEREQIVFLPVLGGGHGDDLLPHHVERRRRHQQAIELALRDRPHQRRAFDQLVAGRREDPPLRLGRVLDLVSRSADALQRDGDRSRRSDLADEIDGADVDAQLERRGGDDRLELSGFELLFGRQPQLARQAAVMREHRVFAEPLGQMVRHALGQPPRVDEDERRFVFAESAR